MKNCITMVILLSGMFFCENVYSKIKVEQNKDSLTLDENIRFGVLENGLTYYIKPIKESHSELKMTFLVKAGSSYEEEHEIDFAHHIEHLAFRESENFPDGLTNNSLLLSSLNMNSRNLFANTGGKATAYYFDPPKENLEAIATGLLWFKDIANGLDLSEKSINRERGVLLQEYLAGEATRDKRNAERALETNLFPCLINKENFIEHNRSFPYQDLDRFYKKWYSPDRMAVCIVGNIKDVKKIEQLIMQKLTSIKTVDKPIVERNCGDLYFKSKPGFSVVKTNANSLQNSIGRSININLFFRDPSAWENNENWVGIQRNIEGELITKILNRRFSENAKEYNNTSTNYSTHTQNYVDNSSGKPESALKIFIRSDLKNEKEALRKTIFALKQLKVFGVTKEELEEVKKEAMDRLNPSLLEKPDYWMDGIENHFIYGEPLPKGKNSLLRDWLTNLSLENINATIREIITSMPEDIGVIFSEDYTTDLSSETKTRKLIKEYYQEPVSKYEFPETPSKLLSDEEINFLRSQENLKSKEGALDSRIYKLKNGLTLILKNLKYKPENQNIIIHGFIPQGASCFPESDYYSAMFAQSVIGNSGVGNLKKFDLERFYKNTNSLKMGISPYIDYHEAGMKAEVSPEEFEDLLQLVYLYFTKPRKDQLAFEDWRNLYLKNGSTIVNPVNDLLDAIQDLTKDYSRLPYSSKKISAIRTVDFDKVYEIHDKLFNDVENFTFVITGSFDENEILPLLQKYLGNLPTSIKPVCKGENKDVNLGLGPVYQKIAPIDLYSSENSYYGLSFVRPRGSNDNWKEELRVTALGMVTNKLIFGLRAEEGLSLYYFGAGGKFNRIMNRYEIVFRFNCIPEELSIIRKLMWQTITDIKQGKVSNEVFRNGMSELFPQFSRDVLEQPSKIGDQLYKFYRYEEPIISPSEVENYLKSLTIEDLAKTAREYFQDEYLYELVIAKGVTEN